VNLSSDLIGTISTRHSNCDFHVRTNLAEEEGRDWAGWLGDLGSMRGDRGRKERRTQEWVLAEG